MGRHHCAHNVTNECASTSIPYGLGQQWLLRSLQCVHLSRRAIMCVRPPAFITVFFYGGHDLADGAVDRPVQSPRAKLSLS